jgi:hypothetical protein
MAGADSADQTDSGPSPADGGQEGAGRRRRRRTGRGPIKYFTGAGPRSGLFLWREDCAPIDVLSGSGDDTPIGRARPVGGTESGIAIWEICLAYAKVPGRWIVLGGEFLPKR